MTKTNKFLNYMYTLIGFIFVLYIIYIRFFLVRIPKNLQFNLLDYNYKLKMSFVLFSIVVCIVILITNLKIILKISDNANKLTFIFEFLSKFIDNSLQSFFGFIVSLYKDIYDLISNFSKTFYDFWHIYPEYHLLFIIYFVRLIILLIFLMEVFISFKLDYFYKSLILLCIVLIIKVIIFVLRDFASNVEFLQEVLIIEDLGINEETQEPVTNYKLKSGYEDNDLRYLAEQFILCNKLSGYLEMYDKYNKFFTPKFNIIIYSLYLIGWLYIFYWNIIFNV